MTLSRLGHAHINPFITAFCHGDLYYMLLPKAEMTLESVFEKNRVDDIDHLSWLLPQLSGLADALDKVHREPEDKSGHKGYHGDISANNILLFSGISELCEEEYAYGRLQLCDFGLIKLASKMSPPPGLDSTRQWRIAPLSVLLTIMGKSTMRLHKHICGQ